MPTLAEFDAARKAQAAGQAPVAAAPPQDEGGILSRFFGGAMKTSPLNPMNLVRAASDIPGTLAGAMADPLKNAFQVPGDVKDVFTNERGGGPIMGRVTSALEALKHIGGSVPLIGPSGVNAGEKIGEGDIAGGAGELAGLASGALVPKVAGAAPEAISKVGRGAERAGAALKGNRISLGGVSVPMTGLGAAEALFGSHPIAGAAVAAAPYALEYGGKGLQKLGGSLEGLRDAVSGPNTSNNYKPKSPVRQSVETDPYYAGEPTQLDSLGVTKDYVPKPKGAGFNDILGEEGPSAGFDWPEAGGRFEPDATGSHVAAPEPAVRPSLEGLSQFDAEYPMNDAAPSTPLEQFYADNPGAATGGEGRTTGIFKEGPGGLNNLSKISGGNGKGGFDRNAQRAFHQQFLRDLAKSGQM